MSNRYQAYCGANPLFAAAAAGDLGDLHDPQLVATGVAGTSAGLGETKNG